VGKGGLLSLTKRFFSPGDTPGVGEEGSYLRFFFVGFFGWPVLELIFLSNGSVADGMKKEALGCILFLNQRRKYDISFRCSLDSSLSGVLAKTG
jgi:hypothetical protein